MSLSVAVLAYWHALPENHPDVVAVIDCWQALLERKWNR